MLIKDGIFVVGIDDAPHKRENLTTELFFIFCQGAYLERINHATIDVDGLNSTEMIIETLKPIKNLFQLITTHGITTGGFNVLDIEMIYNALDTPVIAVTENCPRGNFLEAIKNLPNYEERKSIIERAGPQHSTSIPIGEKKVYFQFKGIEKNSAIQFLKKFALRSRLPEQLLLAHKIASGWTLK
ncbi:MAG: endonuclease dU [Promethearchaeota archaeon]